MYTENHAAVMRCCVCWSSNRNDRRFTSYHRAFFVATFPSSPVCAPRSSISVSLSFINHYSLRLSYRQSNNLQTRLISVQPLRSLDGGAYIERRCATSMLLYAIRVHDGVGWCHSGVPWNALYLFWSALFYTQYIWIYVYALKGYRLDLRLGYLISHDL